MLRKKSRIIELNELVYNERHDWTTNVCGIPSIHPGSSNAGSVNTTEIAQPDGTFQNPYVHQAAQNLSDITDYKLEQCNMSTNCRMHGCIGCCLYNQKHHIRTKYNEKKSKTGNRKFYDTVPYNSTHVNNQHKRFCIFGAGNDETAGKGDTPGFEYNTSPTIEQEGHGFKQHLVFWRARNTKRMFHASLFLSQVWRGNMDVKP
jgi:hypothetical protein